MQIRLMLPILVLKSDAAAQSLMVGATTTIGWFRRFGEHGLLNFAYAAQLKAVIEKCEYIQRNFLICTALAEMESLGSANLEITGDIYKDPCSYRQELCNSLK